MFPSSGHLAVGHVKNTKPHLSKLEDKSTPMVLLGYKEGSKVYQLCDPKGGKVVVSRDVMFDEMAVWDWEVQGVGKAGGVSGTFIIKYLVIQGGGGAKEQAVDGPGPAAELAQEEPPSLTMVGAGEQSPPAAAHSPPPQSPTMAAQGTPLEFATPPSDITSSWTPSMTARRFDSAAWITLLVMQGLQAWHVGCSTNQSLSLSVLWSRRCSRWPNEMPIGARRCWRR